MPGRMSQLLAGIRSVSDYTEENRKSMADAKATVQREQMNQQGIEQNALSLDQMRKKIADSQKLGQIMAQGGDPETIYRTVLSQIGPEAAMEYKKFVAAETETAQKKESFDLNKQVVTGNIDEQNIANIGKTRATATTLPGEVYPPQQAGAEMFQSPATQAPDQMRYQMQSTGQEVGVNSLDDTERIARQTADATMQRGLVQKEAELGLTRAANEYTITGPDGKTQTMPKDLWDNFMTQQGQNARQAETLEAAAQRHLDDMEQRRLDREQRATAVTERIKGNTSEKPPTAANLRTFGFYMRAKDAVDTLEGIEDDIKKMGLFDQTRQKYAPNFLQNQLGQTYEQAQRQFTEARLRKDSGAAIPPHEYDNDKRTYFVQPGDTPATLDRKKKARGVLIQALQGESGRAYTQSFGSEPATAGGEIAVIAPDGTEGTIPAEDWAAAQAEGYRRK